MVQDICILESQHLFTGCGYVLLVNNLRNRENTDDGISGRAPLRRGWTTGACATAATRAAYQALITGAFPDPVPVTLPNGARPAFALAKTELGSDFAQAGVVKDAGDDPDVTHGALVVAIVRRGMSGSGVTFRAGDGVGSVTKPGLPIAPGEPAINPVPRQMMAAAVRETAEHFHDAGDVVVEISIPGGEALAQKTLNPRLGIVGGLSVLGTTGIVVPYSCAAWIDTIHRGIDVARAVDLRHVAGATGKTSETAVQKLYGLPEDALIDMGDFVGGMLKYLKRHPVLRVTIAGGFAKMTKLGQGLLDLHSKRGSVDFDWLAKLGRENGATEDVCERIRLANTAQQVLVDMQAQGLQIGHFVAQKAWETAAQVIRETDIVLDIVVFDREGQCVGRTDAMRAHDGRPR